MRKRIQDVEKRRLIKEWDNSGLSAAVFGERHGVHPVTLQTWGREVRGPLRRSRRRPVAREVQLVELPKSEPGELRVELELGKERRLVVAGALTSDQLFELAVALSGVPK